MMNDDLGGDEDDLRPVAGREDRHWSYVIGQEQERDEVKRSRFGDKSFASNYVFPLVHWLFEQ